MPPVQRRRLRPAATYLVVHTAEARTVGVAAVQSGRVRMYHYRRLPRDGGAGRTLLTLMAECPRRWRKFAGIVAVIGRTGLRDSPTMIVPASFTQQRLGVVVANALAFALRVPVIGISADAEFTLNWLTSLPSRIHGVRPRFFATPAYAKAPNISQSANNYYGMTK